MKFSIYLHKRVFVLPTAYRTVSEQLRFDARMRSLVGKFAVRICYNGSFPAIWLNVGHRQAISYLPLIFGQISLSNSVNLRKNKCVCVGGGGGGGGWGGGGRDYYACHSVNIFMYILHRYPRWLSRMRVRLVIRSLRARSSPGRAIFFRGDLSWNVFYGHSLPSVDSRRAVVSFWRKNVHRYWLTDQRTKTA